MKNLNKNGFARTLRFLPPDYVTINQNFSPIPQICTQIPTILTKNNFGKFPSFPEKPTLCAKLEQKWFLLEYEVLPPPDYLTVSPNFTPIPESYTPKTMILITKNFLKISQFRGKNLHCVPNQYKIDPQFHIQFQIQFHIQCFNLLLDYLLLFGNFTPIPQIYTHRATKSS